MPGLNDLSVLSDLLIELARDFLNSDQTVVLLDQYTIFLGVRQMLLHNGFEQAAVGLKPGQEGDLFLIKRIDVFFGQVAGIGNGKVGVHPPSA